MYQGEAASPNAAAIMLCRLLLCRRRGRLLVVSGLLWLLFLASVSIYRRHGGNDKRDSDEDRDVVLMLRKTKNQKEYIDRKGIHVIVGHYIGNDMPWEKSPNLTQAFQDYNGFSPIPLAGELGQPVQVGPHERERMRTLFQLNKFNLLASDRIALNRSLLDIRKPSCRNKTYGDLGALPRTSVIIVFHNEAWSTLLRTVHSVINRSPRPLVEEIILVDDASTRKYLFKDLEVHVSQLSVPVRILRSANRTGLIRARLMGAKIAKGQVLTFLDAHCECAKGWLEPLLFRIAEDRTRVVCPVIDIIHDETFGYAKSFELHWGAFNWELHFRWFPIGSQEMRNRKTDNTWPFRTPVMAGGLFSIDKLYFEEMGTYDNQMDIWGGENIELSFRIWQCGGSLEIVPCSHVGHVFRRSSPYKFPGSGGVGAILYKNLARVAEVWMDEWKEFYFAMNYEAAKLRPTLDVRERRALRRRLKCRSFKWYLDHVWPQHFLPTKTRFFGKIRNKKNDQCLNRPQSKTSSQQTVGKVPTKECVIEIYPQQCFLYWGEGYIMTDESVCLDAPDVSPGTAIITLACNEIQRQKWKYDPLEKTIKHMKTGLCMDLKVSGKKEEGTTIQLEKCHNGESQQWHLETVDWNPKRSHGIT